jgi:hypothetical protein
MDAMKSAVVENSFRIGENRRRGSERRVAHRSTRPDDMSQDRWTRLTLPLEICFLLVSLVFSRRAVTKILWLARRSSAICFGIWRYPHVAAITASFGNYEKSTKINVVQTIGVDYYCFTDNHNLRTSGNWIIDFTPYHLLNLSAIDTGYYPNSRSRNQHTYMTYRFYKMQFYLIPRLYVYDMIIWMDMTMSFANANTVARLWSIFQANPTKQIILSVHSPARQCTIRKEMETSIHDRRWSTTYIMGQNQPVQNVRAQYDYYLRDGYNEEYWKKEDLSYRNGLCIGLWKCYFIAYRMSDPIVHKLSDGWYLEIFR